MKKPDPDAPPRATFESGFNWGFSPGIAGVAEMHKPRPAPAAPTQKQKLAALARVVREARERRAASVVGEVDLAATKEQQ